MNKLEDFSHLQLRALKVIARTLQIPESQIHLNSGLNETPQWDSLNHMSLIFDLEKEFGFNFSYLEMTQLRNVENIFKTIETKLEVSNEN